MNSNNKLISLVPLQLPVMTLAVQHMGKSAALWCGLYLHTEKPAVVFSEDTQNGSQGSLSATCFLCTGVACVPLWKVGKTWAHLFFPLSL